MKNRIGFGWTLGVLVLVGAKNLQAAPERFGDKGQLVIDERFKLAGTYGRTDVAPGFHVSSTTVMFAPSASYFVVPHLSVGLQVIVGYQSWDTKFTGPGSSSEHNAFTQLGVAPSVGYAVPISDQLAFWPQVAVQYRKGLITGSGVINGNGNTDSSALAFKATMPFVWSPATHFFVGLGPEASYWTGALDDRPFENGTLDIGVSSMIGGNFSP